MSKGNNQKGRYNALNIRLAKYVALVQAVYDALNQQAANIATRVDYDGSKEFHFSDFPEVKEAVQRLQLDYVQSMRAIIYRCTSDEWKQSNLIQDLLADKILGRYGSHAGGKKHDIYYQTNSDALKAFQQRKDNGMGLSQRLWNISGNYKDELEYSISTAIQRGTSAVQLSKKLSKYLNDFPSLKKDYKEKYGKAVDCHDCEYRSIRLARSEINMAYRSAEQTRWMQMDFVLGKEIKLSKGHKDRDKDICDILAGRYPKDFDWKGWHSNCTCYQIPILKTEEEYWHDEDTPPINQTKPITEFPSAFNEYMEAHLEKISTSNHKGTLSYWLRDNADVKGCALLMNKAKQVGDAVQQIAERVAGEHGAKVTPINYKGFASLYRKVHYADQDGVRTALSEIKDSVRNTIALDGDLGSVIKDLAKDSHWLRTKIQTADKFCGYTGNIVNLTMDNGVVAEIQVNTPKMIFAKESERRARPILGNELYDKIAKGTGMEGGLGHKLYEQIRVLDKVADAEKKAELEKQMKEYYSHFQPYVMTEEAVDRLHNTDFMRFDAKAYNHSAMRGFNLEQFDNDMMNIGDEHKIFWSGRYLRILQNKNVELHYKGIVEDLDFGDVVLDRSFIKDGEKRIVIHNWFELPPEIQGKGISKQIMKSLFQQYENMGIDEVELTANMDVGGYAWAKYGFSTSKLAATNIVKKGLETGKITKTQYDEVMSIIELEGENVRMNFIAQLPYGQKLLKGSKWRGFFNMHDKERLKYFHDYVGM